MIQAFLLRIADVGADDFRERKLVARLELDTQVLRLDGKLATDCVLDIENGGIEVVEGERVHG